jgi:hypothetical protein
LDRLNKWNENENPKINPWVYIQLIFTRGPRPFSGEKVVFSKQMELRQLNN